MVGTGPRVTVKLRAPKSAAGAMTLAHWSHAGGRVTRFTSPVACSRPAPSTTLYTQDGRSGRWPLVSVRRTLTHASGGAHLIADHPMRSQLLLPVPIPNLVDSDHG